MSMAPTPLRGRAGRRRGVAVMAAMMTSCALGVALLLMHVVPTESFHSLARPPARHVRAYSHVRAQLVRVERTDDDDDDDDEGAILQVSQVVDENGQRKEATGRSVASMQFMITRAMQAQLTALGYSEAEINAMEPPTAAAILAQSVSSSKREQARPKRKQSRFELQFTCNLCGAPNSHSISHHAYTKGTVIVTCPGCNATHLVADNLNWIDNDFRNIEEFMEQRGTPVTRIANGDEAATAAAAAAAKAGTDADDADESSTEPPPIKPIDGITDEQAMRIREAVRNHKRRRRIVEQLDAQVDDDEEETDS